MNFPLITSIRDILPAIEGKKEFIVAEREHFDVINYVVMTPDSFPPIKTIHDAMLRECRGIIFDKKGNLLSRPLHKFFNVNEREETLVKNLPINGPHWFFTKEDGSMIRPVWIEALGVFFWCTKMGMSDVAVNADQFANSKENYIRFAEYCRNAKSTPSLEWCSNKNRIVISHPEDKLVLLNMRDNLTGKYYSYEDISYLADRFDIPVVQRHDGFVFEEVFSNISSMLGIEGFVVSFPDGTMVKMKTEEYLRIHKARDTVTNEKALLELFIENKLDDIKPSLTQEDLKIVTDYEGLISSKINAKINWLDKTFEEISNKYQDRRSFAIESNLDSQSKSMIFSKMDGKQSIDIVLSLISKNLSSQTKYQFLMEHILNG